MLLSLQPTSSLERLAELFEPVEAFLDNVEACGIAKPDGAVVAKGNPGDNGNIGLAEKPVGKILRLEAEVSRY